MSALNYVAVGGNLCSFVIYTYLSVKRLRELNHGYRQSGQDSGSAARTIQAAINRAAGAEPAAGASLSPEPVAEEIIAERAWQLSPDGAGVILFSASRHCRWEGPTLRAHELPAAKNTSGIYAVRDLHGTGYENYSVTGTVALSGRVVEGERGYRAEQATIRSLRLRFLPTTYPNYYDPFFGLQMGGNAADWDVKPWAVAEQLATRYQCDCTIDWLPTSNLPVKELVV